MFAQRKHKSVIQTYLFYCRLAPCGQVSKFYCTLLSRSSFNLDHLTTVLNPSRLKGNHKTHPKMPCLLRSTFFLIDLF